MKAAIDKINTINPLTILKEFIKKNINNKKLKDINISVWRNNNSHQSYHTGWKYDITVESKKNKNVNMINSQKIKFDERDLFKTLKSKTKLDIKIKEFFDNAFKNMIQTNEVITKLK